MAIDLQDYLGTRDGKGRREPARFAFGGPLAPGGNVAARVNVGGGRFYVLPVGQPRLSEAEHAQLVEAAGGPSAPAPPDTPTPANAPADWAAPAHTPATPDRIRPLDAPSPTGPATTPDENPTSDASATSAEEDAASIRKRQVSRARDQE